MAAWHRRSHAPGRGGVATTGTGKENDHAVTGLGPGPPLYADDGYASGRGGVDARRAPRLTEMHDDCPDQYHAEGSLCGQRSSRQRLSAVSMKIKGEVSPAGESFYLDVENHQPTASIPSVTFRYRQRRKRTNSKPRIHCILFTCRACIPYTTSSSVNQSSLVSTTGAAY